MSGRAAALKFKILDKSIHESPVDVFQVQNDGLRLPRNGCLPSIGSKSKVPF